MHASNCTSQTEGSPVDVNLAGATITVHRIADGKVELQLPRLTLVLDDMTAHDLGKLLIEKAALER